MNILNRIHFNSAPTLLAAWTGAGNVGILSMDFFRRKLDAQMFAQIDMSQFVTPDSIIVNAGVTHFPETPQSIFYHRHNPDIVLFESNAHAGEHDMEVIRTILELARELNVPRIYTAAALPQPMSHTSKSEVLYACNNPGLRNELEMQGLRAMPDGVISGLNGLMLGFAGARGIDAVCLLATIPAYASGLTYPRAALEIVKCLAVVTNVSFDIRELEQDVDSAEPMFADIEEKLKDFFSTGSMGLGEEFQNGDGDEINIPKEKIEKDDIPKYVMDRIERMFITAKKNKEKARELKSELDKWGLYKFYEDRFLDLFENE
ncbi:MAG: PAC2 family protein [Chitinispirillaceae bacterium]|nr:PAC2 family protein [Chitinispirillaceae bacterium]